MIPLSINAQRTESSSQYAAVRFLELADQNWDRKKSAQLAQSEGIRLNDEHWTVIIFLRRFYLKHGIPSNTQALAKLLNQEFSVLGGCEYLHRLFPGGPISQGSRLANLRTQVIVTDETFGSKSGTGLIPRESS